MKRIKYHVLYKDFNTGEMTEYDVMPSLYGNIFTSDGKLSKKRFHIHDEKTYEPKPIKTRNDLRKFIDSHFRYCYSHKCEWEFIAQDWPNTTSGRDVKVDVYHQLEPNIDLITDLVWEQVKEKIG